MLHGDNKIIWLDCNEGNCHNTTISELFQKFCHISKKDDNDDSLKIKFTNNFNVKIKDMNGWSSIKTIEKIKVGVYKKWTWLKLIYFDNSILTTLDQKIPIYDLNKVEKRFHGLNNYKMDIIDINYVINNIDIFNNIKIKIRAKDNGECYTNKLNIEHIDAPKFGYRIITKTGFYNVNELYLFDN